MSITDGVWDDGEWISWDEINHQIQYKEWGVKYPDADLSLVQLFEDLVKVTQTFYEQTGRNLPTFGAIGELYSAISYGVKLHSNPYAPGSDGKLGDDFVEVKTITPFKGNRNIRVKASGNFSKLVIVRVKEDFEISSRIVSRHALPKSRGGYFRVNWRDLTD